MRSGFTLVELTVALVLFGVMGLGAAELLHRATRWAREADLEERLLWQATAVADSVAAGLVTGSGERIVPGAGTLRWSAGAGGGAVEILRAGSDSAWLSLPVVLGSRVPSPAGFRGGLR